MRLLTFVRKPARRPRPPWSRPQLEQLEDRWCPSASYNAIAQQNQNHRAEEFTEQR